MRQPAPAGGAQRLRADPDHHRRRRRRRNRRRRCWPTRSRGGGAPGGHPVPGRGAGRRPGRVDGRGAAGGRSAGRRTTGPRGRDAAGPDLRRCGRTGQAADPLIVRWGLRPLPTTPTRRRLCPLRCGQTGRRPRRRRPAGLRAVRRPPATASAGDADGPGGSPDAPTTGTPTSATPASGCPRPSAAAAGAGGRARSRRPEPDLHRLRAPRRTAPARTAAPTAHRPRAGPRDRSATPATTPRCAAAAPAPPARPCVASSPHPARTRPPAPTAPACRSRHTCTDCGLEDKALRTRPMRTLRAASPHRRAAARRRRRHIPPELAAVYEAITTTAAPRTALNWLRNGAGAAVLAELASGTTDLTHEALDAHPRRRGADYLRHVLVANEVLPAPRRTTRRTERPGPQPCAGITRERSPPGPRLRHLAGPAPATAPRGADRPAPHLHPPRPHQHHRRGRPASPGSPTAAPPWPTPAKATSTLLAGGRRPATRFGTSSTGPPQPHRPLTSPPRARTPARPPTPTNAGPRSPDSCTTTPSSSPTGSPAHCCCSTANTCPGSPRSPSTRSKPGPQVFLRLGRDDLHIPEPLAGLLQTLARDGRRYIGVGTPTTTDWLFPGLQPGRPLTAARLGERLRKLGIRAQPGRRAALTHLAAQLPAAVLADSARHPPNTAVHWVHDAGGDWNRYAAQLTQTAITNHDECLNRTVPTAGHSQGSNIAGYQNSHCAGFESASSANWDTRAARPGKPGQQQS